MNAEPLRLEEIETTKDIIIPNDPLDRVIGQKNAVSKVKIAVKQRRHLLLVGPPGIGKSMVAQALALELEPPKEELRVLNNPINPERPFIEVANKSKIKEEDDVKKRNNKAIEGRNVPLSDVPLLVSEQLGFRCSSCGTASSPSESICPNCGTKKFRGGRGVGTSGENRYSRRTSPFSDIIADVFETSLSSSSWGGIGPEREVAALKVEKDGRESILLYKRVGEKIRVFDQREIEKGRDEKKRREMKVLVPLVRVPFVHATGASETELLGDIRHDPYGSHPDIGTAPYLRVIPGAIHEAHEGVLFIDELPHMKHLQNFILTAMQEKKFSIIGRNPQSSGAAVKVKDVPCDFLFVGACNIKDVDKILTPLRSRILGNGYELLLETTMPDTEENRFGIAQFIAQEIKRDGRIPHADFGGIKEVIKESRRRAEIIDNTKNSLTLRLRDLGGIIRMAGDIAILENSEFITKEHIKKSVIECKPVEYQIKERYGSIWKGIEKEGGGFDGGVTDDDGYKGYG